MKYHLLFCFFLLLACSVSIAQGLDSTMWMANGPVSALARYGNTLYLGGDFYYVGPRTGSGATLNTTDGQLTPTPLLRIDGSPTVFSGVDASVPDGKGGWFIGGSFTRIQGYDKKYLAHILADGTLDKAWNPNPDKPVTALATHGNVVYVSGSFTTLGGRDRSTLAGLDATTGQATDWYPRVDRQVNTIAVSGNIVYVGGNFSTVDGKPRQLLAALDATTGRATAWDPFVEMEARDFEYVGAVAVSGGVVYAVGYFSRIGRFNRLDIAAFDAATGQLTNWYPVANNYLGERPYPYKSYFTAIAAAGNVVYVSGDFRDIGGRTRPHFAALDATTGQAAEWNANANGPATTIIPAGNLVYAGGSFTLIGGKNRPYLAALDATTGQATGWEPHATSSVHALALAGNVIFAGGGFASIGGVRRNRLAAIDITTGQATAWNPDANGPVTALTASETTVYAGGTFTAAGGMGRSRLAALDAITGRATAWNPGLRSVIYDVGALALAGNVVYLGGTFYTIDGLDRPFLAALDATTGAVTRWSPRCNGPVLQIAVSGNSVYVGGHFTSIGGQNRERLAVVDATTGGATSWSAPANGTVEALALAGKLVYVGGRFTRISGQNRNRLAALDAVTGQATAWNPDADSTVKTIALAGNVVYAGGSFSTIGGQPKKWLVALDAVTGQATTWNSGVGNEDTRGSMLTLNVSDNGLYAGGDFLPSDGKYRYYFTAFGKPGTPLSYVQGTVYEDTNGDCRQNPGEKGLANQVMVARPGDYFTSTDSAGRYTLAVDPGTYTLQQVIPADKQRFMRQICPAEPPTVRFTGAGQTLGGQDFANQLSLVPHLEADVSSTRRRRCFGSTTTVYYANTGTAPATGAKVYVQLPPYVALKSANAPFTRDNDGHYVFDVGTLAPDARGSILLQDSVACGNPAIRGLTQCTRAWITPANPTTPGDGWDRSDVVLKAACVNNGRVRLALYNHGTGNMADSSAFRIYLDAQLAFAGRYQLAPGDSLVLRVPANGRTVRLEADQRPGHPTRRQSHITIEACGTNGSGTVSKGYVAQLPCNDPEPEMAVECLPILDSFDPNDKAVSPRGVGPERYTPTGAALDYVIRFQNTGTDVAYKVVVTDTLSEHLDVSTLRVGTVSHPYKMTVTGKGRPVLTFTFDNINLPDSTADEPRSHGRIQFNIRPKAGLPEKTRVENFADIFFDYNEPIRTNTTLNAIYDVPPVVVEAVRLDLAAICASTNDPAGAGTDQTLCGQVTGAVLGASAPAHGKGKWKRVSGAGVVQDAERPASAVTGLGYGANVFEWSIPANACGSDSLKARVTITRLPKAATPAIARQGTDSLTCSLAGTAYEWSLDGEKLAPSGRTIAASRAGSYRVRVKDEQGCWSDESVAFVYAVTGMPPAVASAIRVYPNPTRGIVTLVLPAGLGAPVQLSVYDALGKRLLGRRLAAGTEKTDVDLSGCAAGLYLIKLETRDGITVRRVFRMD